jgi:hypothetical protein
MIFLPRTAIVNVPRKVICPVFPYLLAKHLALPIFHTLYDYLHCYCQCIKNDRLACLSPHLLSKFKANLLSGMDYLHCTLQFGRLACHSPH